jgi:hypothetical protein
LEVEASYVPISGASFFFLMCQSSFFGVFQGAAESGRFVVRFRYLKVMIKNQINLPLAHIDQERRFPSCL